MKRVLRVLSQRLIYLDDCAIPGLFDEVNESHEIRKRVVSQNAT
jgi:hypothetical protein